MALDTLKISENLIGAGINEKQARAILEAIASVESGVVTPDLLDARLETQEQRIGGRITALEQRLDANMALLRSELKEAIAQNTIKTGVMIAAALGMLLALQKALGL